MLARGEALTRASFTERASGDFSCYFLSVGGKFLEIWGLGTWLKWMPGKGFDVRRTLSFAVVGGS